MILRELFAKLGLDVDAQSFAKGQLLVEAVKFGLEKLTDFAVDTATEFVSMVKETAEAGEKVEQLAAATGVEVDALQDLGTAAELTGTSMDTMATGLGSLARNMLAAKNGSDESATLFRQLGVRAVDAAGKLRPTEEVMYDIADRFSRMENGAQKTALAMQVFGRSGKDLIPLLNKGRDGIAELAAQSANLTEEQIKASVEIVASQKELKLNTKSIWQQAIGPLLPAIRDLVKGYVEWRKANAGVAKEGIQKGITVAIAVVRGLGKAFTFVVGVLKFFKDNWKATMVAIVALTAPLIVSQLALGVTAAASAAGFAAAWLAAAAPILLLAGILAGMLLIFDDIRVAQSGGRSLYGRFKKEIDGWLTPNSTDPWWLAALKDLVRYMQQALGLADELGLSGKGKGALGGPAPGSAQDRQRQAEAGIAPAGSALVGRDDQSWTARLGQLLSGAMVKSGATGEEYSWKAKLTDMFGGQQIPEWHQRLYSPPPSTVPAVAGGGGGGSMSQTNHITVIAQPGQSTEEIASMVDEKIQSSWDDRLESSAAAGGG